MKVQYYGDGVTTSFATPNAIGARATVYSNTSSYKPTIQSQSTTAVVLTVPPPVSTRIEIEYFDKIPRLQSDVIEWATDVSGNVTGLIGPYGTIMLSDVAPYAERVDFVSDTLIYRGEALPGEPESERAWRIRRLTLGFDDDVTYQWAAGTAAFDKVWNDRASLNYL